MRTIVLVLIQSVLLSQTNYVCGTPEEGEEIKSYNNLECTQASDELDDYYRRYLYQEDLFSHRNAVVIPVVIYVWQKNDGSGNYMDDQTNRERLEEIITILDETYYNSNSSPSFQPLSNIIDYDSAK